MFPRPPKELRFTREEQQTMDECEALLQTRNAQIKELEAALSQAKANAQVQDARIAKDSTRLDIELQTLLRTHLKNDLIKVTNNYKNKQEYLHIELKDVNMDAEKATKKFAEYIVCPALRCQKHFVNGSQWGVEVMIPSSFREQLIKALKPVAELNTIAVMSFSVPGKSQ